MKDELKLLLHKGHELRIELAYHLDTGKPDSVWIECADCSRVYNKEEYHKWIRQQRFYNNKPTW